MAHLQFENWISEEAIHPKGSVLLVIAGLTWTCHTQLILLSSRHECHKKPTDKRASRTCQCGRSSPLYRDPSVGHVLPQGRKEMAYSGFPAFLAMKVRAVRWTAPHFPTDAESDLRAQQEESPLEPRAQSRHPRSSGVRPALRRPHPGVHVQAAKPA